jgi:hypothetical protein
LFRKKKKKIHSKQELSGFAFWYIERMPTNISHNDFVCPLCDRPSKYRIKTTCRNCYQKKRNKSLPPAKCHPDRKEHCAGLCRSCYKKGGRAKRAICHPDRFQAANGLCTECYDKLPENIERARKVRRLRKYGLSEEEYTYLLTKQNESCAICNGEISAVDHNHITGNVRGLLCKSCNTGLGLFKDSIVTLKIAISYLENNYEHSK